MKLRLIYTFLMLVVACTVFAQGKNPKIMVVPMDTWCQERGFWNVYENQGEIKGAPNYEQAVQDSRELMLVISKINSLMSDRGFPLADLSQTIKNNTRRTARNTLTTSRTSGSSLAVTALDELNRQAKADILIEVDFSYNTVGPKHSVTYNLRALDAYTGKQVAGVDGTGTPTFTSEIPVLLEEAVVGHWITLSQGCKLILTTVEKMDERSLLKLEYLITDLGLILRVNMVVLNFQKLLKIGWQRIL